MTSPTPIYNLHAPFSASSSASSSTASPSDQPPLTAAQLIGTWHVTHSTLPMWRKNRNISITYTPLPAAPGSPDRLNDLVNYQSLTSSKVQTMKGVDTLSSDGGGSVWNWRGKGILMLVGSQWEILGWGEEEEADATGRKNVWAVTYFSKTLFTPAGIDFYSRDARGLQEATMQGLREALGKLQDQNITRLVKELFDVKRDAEQGVQST
jgi:hypothetical protein